MSGLDLLPRVSAAITRHALFAPGAVIVVAVSGGADSLVLLHVLDRLRDPMDLTLHAATLDHGLRGAAGAADAAFVRHTAAAWGIPCSVGRADVPALAQDRGWGIEDAARRARYAFLLRVACAAGADVIAAGHQRDDQAETVLMHLIRGSGLHGLRGILPRATLTAAQWQPDLPLSIDPPLDVAAAPPDPLPALVRPLIDIPRAAIAAYAAAYGLCPRTDTTNADTAYTRNRLRHDVIPLLERLNPNLRETLARTAGILRTDADLIDQVGAAALARVVRSAAPDVIALDRGAWAALSLAEKRQVIRLAAARLRPDQHDVAFSHVEQAIRVADGGAVGAQAALPDGLRLRVDYAVLLIGCVPGSALGVGAGPDAPALVPGQVIAPFAPGQMVRVALGDWVFESAPLAPGEDVQAWHDDPLAAALVVPSGAVLSLRTRRAGDRFLPRGLGGHSQKLADTLINMRVPAASRDRVPLLVAGDMIAWFVAPSGDGVRGRVAEPFAIRAAGPGPLANVVVVRWRRPDS